MLEEKKNGQLKRLTLFLSVMPFVLGTVGYLLSGEKISNSLYYSFSLYFINLNSDSNNLFIDIARWTAALVVVTAILYVLNEIWQSLRRGLKSLRKDSVAIYSDADREVVFENPGHPVIYAKRTPCPKAKSHIIMMDTDSDSLKFYHDHKGCFGNGKVYIGLKELEYGLIKDISDVQFFDIDGSIARTLWKSIKLWNKRKDKKDYKISIMGNGHLGQNILNYGLLLNLFSLDQCITYNLIGSEKWYQIVHEGMDTCNQDKICFYDEKADEIGDVLRASDLIIIAGRISVGQLQAIGVLGEKGQVYYYMPDEGDVGRYLKLPNLIPYGADSEIYTDENIRGNHLIEQAIDLNYQYVTAFSNRDQIADAQGEWDRLDGFLKWSNISGADYMDVIDEILRDVPEGDQLEAQIEEVNELEHIRWCRFHYLNHWKYGIPQNGTNKDTEKKIHACLRPYGEISDEDKEKDRKSVKKALKRKETDGY